MQKIILTLTIVSLTLAGPVPTRKPGYNFGNLAAKTKIELFVDPHCPASKAFFDLLTPALNTQVKGSLLLNQLAIAYHVQPLPYHHHAFLSLKVIKFLEQKYPSDLTKFLAIMFNKIDFYNAESLNRSHDEVKKFLILDAVAAIGHGDDNLTKVFTTTEYEREARFAFKYAAYRGVTGCPFFFVNGVRVEDMPESVKALVNFLTRYI